MIIAFVLAAAPARAAEPRPWLCRDKPVFSSATPMTYQATNNGGGSWLLTFMRFNPNGGHDNFDVTATRSVSGAVTGPLDAGQWYAVGLYRQGGSWICAKAEENRQFTPGIVRTLCYGDVPGACQVKLVVHKAAAH